MKDREASDCQIRRKSNYLPDTFFSSKHDGKLLASLACCFERLLFKHRADSQFAHRLWRSTLDKHSLLNVQIPLELDFGRLEARFRSTTQSTEGQETEVARPISCGVQNLGLPLEWSRMNEEAYRHQTAAILAYMLAWRLSAYGARDHHLQVLEHLDELTLERHLSSTPRGKISIRSLASAVLKRIVESEMERPFRS